MYTSTAKVFRKNKEIDFLIREFKVLYYLKALKIHNFNYLHVAQALGISRTELRSYVGNKEEAKLLYELMSDSTFSFDLR